MKFLILLLIFFHSCAPFDSNEVTLEQAEIQLYHDWIYTFKVNELTINSEEITRPPGIERLLFSLMLPVDGGGRFKKHCVYYQVPYKKIIGVIKIDEKKNEIACPSTSSGKNWLQIKDVANLRIKLDNFKLSLNFSIKKQKKNWVFFMPNIENGLIHEKYGPQKEKKLYPGMTFLKINKDSFDPGNNKYLGKLSDRVSRGSAIRCYQVDKSCRQIGEDRCDECRYGWYEVVDFDCPKGGSKFCGQNHCGEKNEPACIRGRKVTLSEDDAEARGICQNDLGAVMNADHILICQ